MVPPGGKGMAGVAMETALWPGQAHLRSLVRTAWGNEYDNQHRFVAEFRVLRLAVAVEEKDNTHFVRWGL